MFQPWKGVFTCGKRSSQVAKLQERTVNGMLTYRCRDVLFSPKNGDFKTKISTETWVSHFSGKAPPCSELQQFPLPTTHHQPGKRCLGASGVPMELCGENKIWNKTVRRLTSLLAPLLQRGPGVLAESFTSHWDA